MTALKFGIKLMALLLIMVVVLFSLFKKRSIKNNTQVYKTIIIGLDTVKINKYGQVINLNK